MRENIVATLTGFIWFVLLHDIRHGDPDEYQDLDTFRYGAVDLPLLYPTGGGEIVRFKGVYFDSPLFLSTGTYDCAPGASVRSFARYVLI